MPLPGAFLSCDWGTSHFRIRRVETAPFRIDGLAQGPRGVLSVRDRVAREGTASEAAFEETLGAGLEDLAAACVRPLDGLPVVISGMASSSIGWREIPYARVPFPTDGSALRFEELEIRNLDRKVFLLSGLQTEDDVMRGEETEVIGILAEERYRARLDGGEDGAVVVLPGTHSKHVRVREGIVTTFSTYMTGELYSLLSQKSILRHSVGEPSSEAHLSPGPAADAAFRRGALRSRAAALSGTLFSVRARQLLEGSPAEECAACLSGLLIGCEVADAGRKSRGDGGSAQVLLAAGPGLSRLYALAFEALGLSNQVTVVPPEDVSIAAARGHLQFLRQLHEGSSS